MSIAITAVLVILFIFGASQSQDLAKALKEPADRQKLVLRVLGFVLMSMWLHALPSMLMLNYLRFEGILASDVLSDDAARTSTIGLFGILQVSIIIACSCSGLVVALMDKNPWRLRNLSTIMGIGFSVALLWAFSLEHGGFNYASYLGLIVLAFSVYIHLSLLNPLVEQIRLYSIPFTLITIVTLLIFLQRGETHSFVAEQLRDFRAGGSVAVAVELDGKEYLGRLVLLTSKEIFLNYHPDDKLYEAGFISEKKKLKEKCLIILQRERSVLILPYMVHLPQPKIVENHSETYCNRLGGNLASAPLSASDGSKATTPSKK